MGMLWGPWKEQRRCHRLFLGLLLKNILKMSLQEPWKITSEFPVVSVPADSPVLGSEPLLRLGQGNVAAHRESICTPWWGWHCRQAHVVAGAWLGHLHGAGSAELMVREKAGLPSALLGSIPAFRTKAGAFPQLSASAWKATGCQHLLCGVPWCCCSGCC